MPRQFRLPKEPFCGFSHWLGVALSVVGIGFLLINSIGKPTHLIAFSIYGFALISLYLASSLYHSLHVSEDKEKFLRKFDHSGIFLLISGTYVPVCLIALPSGLCWTLLTLQASLAAFGIIGTFVMKKFPSVLNVVLYLVMGWMAVAALGYISHNWPHYASNWLVAGGLIYTFGAVIYATDKPHLVPGKFSAHDLWHIFVLAGSFCHFALMATYIVHLP